jgi:uncharacterized protein (TIGR02145 family)
MKTKNRTWLRPLVIVIMGLLCLASWCKKEEDNNTPSSITDEDGNVYTSVTIGTQVWMVENLKTTKLNDGAAITYVTDGSAWNVYTTSAYCFYNGDANNKSVYGALYNWYAVSTGKLCPTGWHVPSFDELDALGIFLGYEGGKLKEVGTSHWASPNGAATNETGFTALPGGMCSGYASPWDFRSIGESGYWWTTTDFSTNGYSYHTLFLMSLNSTFNESNNIKADGLSVRCIKN